MTRTTTRKHFGARTPRALAAALATATVLTLAGATTAVAASSGPARILPAAAPSHHAAYVTCTVNDNGVNYRSGPGENYQVFGTVNRGQKINVRGQQGNWYMGDLWGGRTGVWIHVAYVTC
ncbi:SH3 domain-containing protein [Streptomyces fuscigenes]|uniref:SH3 domain-containing protein n=1 Tax=Streptomyces fuscigenes TaxID=1528880 RepID=UPI001F44CA61|nr:SH3 domain-containing protein [Streptomyces fuscigenes]MCF3961057.1 SH3 domain-containing protein [Streptomyces fuscigenes]